MHCKLSSFTRATLVALLVCLTTHARAETHEFSLDASAIDPKPKTVHLAGDFNGWSKVANPMSDSGDGVYKVTVDLGEGVHHYKFVLDGEKWINDPKFSDKDLEVDDNYGGKNSAVMIGPDARKLPPPAPDKINSDGILHRANSAEDVNVATPNLVRLRIRTQAGDVQSAFVNVRDESGTKIHSLYPCGSSLGFDFFGGAFTTQGDHVDYWFTLTDGQAKMIVSPQGTREIYPGDEPSEATPTYRVEMKPKFQTPDWAKGAVWYQIFPERFRNGDPSNDPGDKPYEHLVTWTGDWWKAQPGEEPGDENFYKGKGNVWKRRYGGDIQGLIQELPYLKSLGVTAIYLNPMFKAESMHKYDTEDYRHIDDHFGKKGDIAALHGETDDPSTWQWTETDKLFLDFVAKAHAMGFKVILDGVFNHVGREFWAFQDVLKNGKNSKYADWFDVRDWNEPIKYIAWDRGANPSSDGSLPVFKKNGETGLGPGPTAHIFAITKRWLAPDGDPSKGVDGFRLDVPGDIPHPFWIEWHKLVKSTKPDAYISGEIWEWAQPWLNDGDQFDAVMNYRFATAAQDFFVNQSKAITPTQFNSRLNQMLYNYPLQVAMVQQNLFDSHDTDRLASMFVNPDVQYDASNRIQDNGPKYSSAKPGELERVKQKQAVALQMTFVGAPMTYYGDENGMWSPDDPSNRQPMVWKDLEPYDDPQVKFDDDLFKWHQRLIAIRHTLPALSTGFFHAVKMDDGRGVYVFARDQRDQTVYVVLNRSPQEQTVEIEVGGNGSGKFIDWLSESQAKVVPPAENDPGARATIAPIVDAPALQADHSVLSVPLKAYGAAILTEQPR
jgi:glycosidase